MMLTLRALHQGGPTECRPRVKIFQDIKVPWPWVLHSRWQVKFLLWPQSTWGSHICSVGTRCIPRDTFYAFKKINFTYYHYFW
jgi:hypothetical protein